MIDSFPVPFFAAAALGLLTLFAAMRWLPDSLPAHAPRAAGQETDTDWRTLARRLGLALAGQIGLAIFEGTFALCLPLLIGRPAWCPQPDEEAKV
jgi:predicted MFS family arabinose efflux permease